MTIYSYYEEIFKHNITELLVNNIDKIMHKNLLDNDNMDLEKLLDLLCFFNPQFEDFNYKLMEDLYLIKNKRNMSFNETNIINELLSDLSINISSSDKSNINDYNLLNIKVCENLLKNIEKNIISDGNRMDLAKNTYFFPNHYDKYKNNIDYFRSDEFKNNLCQNSNFYNYIKEKILNGEENKWSFENLSLNNKIEFDFVKKYENKNWNWDNLITNINIDSIYLRNNTNYFILYLNKYGDNYESDILLNKNIDTFVILNYYAKKKIYISEVELMYVAKFSKLNLDNLIIADKLNLILWEYLSSNKNITIEIVSYFINKPWNFNMLQQNIPIEFIYISDIFKNKINYKDISSNVFLENIFISKYQNILDWDLLSKNSMIKGKEIYIKNNINTILKKILVNKIDKNIINKITEFIVI